MRNETAVSEMLAHLDPGDAPRGFFARRRWNRTQHQISVLRETFETVTRAGLTMEQLFLKGQDSRYIKSEVNDAFRQVFSEYVAVSKVAQSAASVRWSLVRPSRSGKNDIIEEHSLYDLITNELLEATYTLLEMRGSAYWWLQDASERGGVGGIHLLRGEMKPDAVVSAETGLRELRSWKYRDKKAGMRRTFTPEEICCFRFCDPDDEFSGVAPSRAADLSHKLSWASQEMQRMFYNNAGLPPFYIKLEQDDLPPEDEARMRSWLDGKVGLRRFFKPWFLWRGAELKSVAIDQKNSEWVNTQLLATKQIFASHGLPMSIGGFTDDANRSISVEERRQFWGGTIRTRGELVSSRIQSEILDRWYKGLLFSYDWQAKFAEVMPEELRAAVTSAHAMVQDGIPAKDAYAIHGITLDTDGKPWLEIGWLPFNLTPADAMMAGGAAASLSEGEGQASVGLASVYRRGWPKSESVRSAIWRSVDSVQVRLERSMLRDWRGFLSWYLDAALSSAKRRSGRTGLHAVDALLRLDDGPALPSLSEASAEAVERTEATVKRAVAAGYKSVAEQAGVDIAFDLLDPRVVQLLAARKVSIKSAVATLDERVRAEIAEGVDAGESIDDLADRIRGFMKAESVGMAKTVARTEGIGPFSAARYEAMQEAGIEKHEWLSARDDKVRDSHQIDGEIRTIGEPFSNGMLHPGDPSAPAEEAINDRCVALPVAA